MLSYYERFLTDFDRVLKKLFETQKQYIKCKKGCTKCCEKGNYPLSQLEFAYITKGFINLPDETKRKVQIAIKNLQKEREQKNTEYFEHGCPFLIDKECSVYEYRAIVCRTFGICYWDEKNGYVRLPECVNEGLNYSQYYDKKDKTLKIPDVPKVNLRIDRVLNSELAKEYGIECGEIRPMLDWISKQTK